MSRRDVAFEAADVEQLYRGGKPSSWEELRRRAEQSAGRRRRITEPEAHEMAHVIEILRKRGGAIPDTPRQCYLQMMEVLEPIPGPGVYPA